MKRWIRLCAMAGVFGLPVPASAQTVRVTTTAEVREWRNARDVIATVAPGTLLEVLDEDRGWYWVVLPADAHGTRRSGWVDAASVEDPAATRPPDQAVSNGGARPATATPLIARPLTPRGATRLTPFAVMSTAFDSNINHDAEGLDGYGMVLGAGAVYRNDPRDPVFEVQYQAGFHRYANTARWNRLSHHARASREWRVSRRVGLEAVGELSLRGSTEDRELSNQFLVSPRLEYRIARALRVRGVAAWRVKRHEDSPDRNAWNRYGGLELVGRPRSGLRWEAGGRYELNAAESSRQRYRRWTWYGGLSVAATASDRIEVEMRYRRQRYPFRLVDVKGGPDAPRRDVRIEPELVWLRRIDDDLELRAGYAFSARDSNDPRRDYRSHELLFGVLQRW